MILAEFGVWHTRPVAPTRRVVVGDAVLPFEPTPGFGGLLLAGVVGVHAEAMDDDHRLSFDLLMDQLERGERIAQPQLRHRLQRDRVGLISSTHRLVGRDDALEFEFEPGAPAEPQLLGAVYLAAQEPPERRRSLFTLIRSATRWKGGPSPDLIPFLTGLEGRRGCSWFNTVDPWTWALKLLGFETHPGTRNLVQSRFRSLLREAHPDHGAARADAGRRIQELTEARRILLERDV